MSLTRVGVVLISGSAVPAGNEWLARGERERLAGMGAVRRREDFRLGRWAAKRAIAGWLGGVEPGRIEVVAAASGAPEAWLDGAPLPVVLSISHRARQALVAVAAAGARLGCDLELVEERSAGFVADFFTASERALCERCPVAARQVLANLIWCGKESAAKALGEGLRIDTRELEVEVGIGDQERTWSGISATKANGDRFAGWWRRQGAMVLSVLAQPPADLPVWLDPGTPAGAELG